MQVDLGAETKVDSAKIDWESTSTYSFTLEGSTDGKTWALLVDGSKNDKPSPNALSFKPAETRYVRVTFLGSSSSQLGNINGI